MLLRFEKKVAIVTGAASGIGRAAAERLAAEGAAVAVADVNSGGAETVAAALVKRGQRAIPVTVDVRSSAQVAEMVKRTVAAFGRLDVLFANAGIGSSSLLVETTDEEWERVHAVNERGVFYSCREAARQMLAQKPPGGSIVINGSISGLAGIPGQAAYAPPKGAVVEMTRQLAVELATQGIRVNCVCPGTVDTPSLGDRIQAFDDPVQARKDFIARQPMGRLAVAEEIAETFVYLVSDESSFMTGQAIFVDGGMSL